MSRFELGKMTWKEVEAARDRETVVLIPIGTTEQNGSIAPLSSDTLVADEVARKVAEATGSLVAPPVHFGYSPPFIHHPGTISLRPETLRALILDILDNLVSNGFKRLIMVNCHIFNEPPMEQAATEIRKRSAALLGSFNPITLAQRAAREVEPGIEAAFGHGTEPIASMLLSFAPDTVRTEAADPRPWGEYRGLQVPFLSQVKVGKDAFGLYFDIEEVSETGGSGDPRRADAARGAEIMKRVVEAASEYVKVFGGLPVPERK